MNPRMLQIYLLSSLALVLALMACILLSGCSGVLGVRRLERQAVAYCFDYELKNTKARTTYCADSKYICEGMRRKHHEAGFKILTECSLY